MAAPRDVLMVVVSDVLSAEVMEIKLVEKRVELKVK